MEINNFFADVEEPTMQQKTKATSTTPLGSHRTTQPGMERTKTPESGLKTSTDSELTTSTESDFRSSTEVGLSSPSESELTAVMESEWTSPGQKLSTSQSEKNRVMKSVGFENVNAMLHSTNGGGTGLFGRQKIWVLKCEETKNTENHRSEDRRNED